MEALPLFKNNKERLYFYFIVIFIFCINLYINYQNYKSFKTNEVFQTDATILNIYNKKSYSVLKLKTKEFICFTATNTNNDFQKLQTIDIFLITKNISFYQYLNQFYTKSFNISILNTDNTIKYKISNTIYAQHNNSNNSYISSLYSALFLAIPLEPQLRDIAASFGVSHLIAISGFHLGVIAFVLYFIINLIYKPIQQNFLPFRNKKYDILLLTICAMFCYLIFVDLVPSLIRAFTMFVFGIFLLRNNIKLLSFETLFIIVCIIIAIFPKLLFSLSLWFSVAGVFYIFLFIKYFKELNRYIQFILFNFWIYLAINPITHYFFDTTSIEQLYSPIITILFTIFYPLTALLHLIGEGSFFDTILLDIINLDIEIKKLFTPLWFFIVYILISLSSIFSKKGFILLNLLFLLFNIWLYAKFII